MRGTTGHSAFENNPWILRLVEYTAQAMSHPRVRVIGVCFGHQIVGRAMGVKVARGEKGWETSVCGVDLTDLGRKLFDGRESLVRSWTAEEKHGLQVYTRPPVD